jgi:hypothetical protein
MAVVTTKSPSIVNWDAQPIFVPTTGEGGEGPLRIVNDSVSVGTGDSANSIYRLVRFPTNAKVKSLFLGATAIATAGSADIDVAFSDSTTDGTQQSLAGGIVQLSGPVDNKLFGAAQSILAASLTARLDETFKGTFLFAHQNLPMWQVLVALGATQFVADPGGFFDIVAKVTTGITTGGILNCELQFVE